MLEYNFILEEATKFLTHKSTSFPEPDKVVQALLEAEKSARKSQNNHEFSDLLGTWRLCFITGTKKTRAKAGIVLGAGRYIPKYIKITLSYIAKDATENHAAGIIENCVEFGIIKLTLSGVTNFLPKKNILAFDFTRINIKILGATIYKGYIRGGETKEQQFYQESVSKQAFFAYFLIADQIIAARGKGGGLALWTRE